MKTGDIVQVRQVDTSDHCIYAKVLDPATRLVEVQHPGNRDHGKHLTPAAEDIRTKADLQALITTAQGMAAGKLTDAQLNTMGAADSWVLTFKDPKHSQERDQLNKVIVQHYQAQVKQLS